MPSRRRGRPERFMTRTTHVLGCLGLALTLAGCLADGNARNTLGPAEDPVALADISAAGARSEAPLASDQPSLQGLSRANWSERHVVTAPDGTEAFPTYATHLRWTADTSRQRGGPVSPMSALDLSGQTFWMQTAELAAAGPLALYDLLKMPYGVYQSPPWDEVRHTPHRYWRTTPGVATRVETPASGAAE